MVEDLDLVTMDLTHLLENHNEQTHVIDKEASEVLVSLTTGKHQLELQLEASRVS